MIITLVGFIGMGLVLIAFIMLEFKKWKAESLIYDSFNALGAFLLAAYAFILKSYPFLIINIVWGLVAVYDIFKKKRHKHHPGKKHRK